MLVIENGVYGERALASAVSGSAGYCSKQDQRGAPFTPAIPAFYALAAVLAEHAEAGGWPARHGRYRALAEITVS